MLRWGSLFFLLVAMTTIVHAEERPANSVVDLNALLNLDSLVDKVADRRVVFVGESHDQYQHHLNQLAIIKGLHARHPDLAIGLEFFFQPYQSVLDRYVAGKIDEPEFLRGSQYFDRWRFDYRLYRPIFRYAREQGIPLIALNVESEITKKVGKEGFDSLSKEEKRRLPADIDRSNEAYRNRIKAVYDQHPHQPGQDFEHFLDAQLVWDEGMAAKAAEWLQAHPGRHMVILAGIGHVVYRQGIPDRLKRRDPVSSAVVLNVNQTDELDPTMADFLIMAGKNELPRAGKLGVFLDLDDVQPRVSGFDEGSGAARAGVKEGDLLTAIDGMPVKNYADLRIALLDKAVGDEVKLEVERKHVFLGSTQETFSVTLN